MSLSVERPSPENQQPQLLSNTDPFRNTQRSGAEGILAFMAAIRRRILLSTLTFLVVLGLFVAYLVTRQPLYLSDATIDLNPNGSSGASIGDLLQSRLGFDELNAHLTTQVEVMRSVNLQLDVCNRLELLKSPAFLGKLKVNPNSTCNNLAPNQRDLVVARLQQIIVISAIPGTNLVRVAATTPDPKLSERIAGGVVEAYIDSNLSAGIAGTNRVGDWLGGQMRDLRQQVNLSQQKLSEYQRSKNVVDSDETGSAAVSEVGLLENQIATAAADRIEKEARLRVAESSSPELMSSLAEGDNIQVLRRQRVQLQADYDLLTSKFGPNYPRVRELAVQIAASQAALDKEVATVKKRLQNDYSAALQTESELNARLEQKKQAAFRLNDSAAEYAILRHNAESARDLYDAIQYKLRESGIMDTLKSAQIRLIEPAIESELPVFPRKGRTLFLGLLTAIIAGVGVGLVRDRLDDALHAPELVEKATNIPVLVTVPHIDRKLAAANKTASGNVDLVALSDENSAGAESYRALRSSVLLSNVDMRIRLQLITSGSQAEGKSFTACNYAITLARQGGRVLLVDADLRRGSIHAKFGFRISPGFTELLSSDKATADFVQRVPGIPNLEVLTMGVIPPNPSEILNSRRLEDLIQMWRAEYDYIIIDSAPLLPVADSYGLAAKADAVLIVARAEKTKIHALMRTEQILRRIRAHITGVIVNDVTSRSRGYQYNYYGEYKYNAAEGTEGKKDA